MTYRIFPGTPAPPATKECDWCGEPAASAHELQRPRKKMGKALYLYACRSHKQTAERVAEGYKQPKKKEPVQEKIVGPGGAE